MPFHALGFFAVFEQSERRLPPLRSVLALDMSEVDMSSDQKNQSRLGPFPRLKAILGCYCLHVGLTLLLIFCLFVFGIWDSLAWMVVPYLLLGWIPLAVWLYPILRRRMRWF
jgi:hypothetical protein